MQNEEYDIIFKVVVIGDSQVGKTNLLSRYTKRIFKIDSNPTIGVEFATKVVPYGSKNVKLQLWDTAGQERYRAITASHYRRSSGALVVYDITKYQSFVNAEKWLGHLIEVTGPEVTVILVGNKSDKNNERAVNEEEAKALAKKHKIEFIETSALNNTNIDKAFEILIQGMNSSLEKEFTKDETSGGDASNPKKKAGLNLKNQREQEKKFGCC